MRIPTTYFFHPQHRGFLLFLAALFAGCCGNGSSFAGNSPVQTPQVREGAARTETYFPLINGKRIGITANHTATLGKLHLVDTLLHSGMKIMKIFAPEHGFRGDADAGALIGDSTDAVTHLRVISLYGNKKKPDAADLNGLDIMIFDIQDVGVRFFTYISTLHYVMEACAENGIPLLVLDRPNPNGHYTDGPVCQPAFRSFVGMHPIPVVYGMTIGELALMINGEGWLREGIQCNLTVVSCEGYTHSTKWVPPLPPSPNLSSPEAVYLYPSLCFFEGTLMSVGRGTITPFRLYGHPEYPLRSFSYTPKPLPGSKNPLYNGKTCYGKDLRFLSADSLHNLAHIDLGWLLGAYSTMNRQNDFFNDFFDRLAGNSDLRNQIVAGTPEHLIRKSWQKEIRDFIERRKPYLLYPE